MSNLIASVVVINKAGQLPSDWEVLERYEIEGIESPFAAQTIAQRNASRDYPALGGQVEVYVHCEH